jgi:predicted  nucleic acid-binding Zn-ribbon protein
MTNPVLDAFFAGRALALSLAELAEDQLTDRLSDLGRLEAEQREQLRRFVEQVLNRAAQAKAEAVTASADLSQDPIDLQTQIDELRAEIASARAELRACQHRRLA